MGSCFSALSGANAGQSPASHAAQVAESAAHAVSQIIGGNSAPSSASHTQTDPPGLQIIANAYVFKMPDGDTFTCEYTESGIKKTARVRIMGIDCPETKQNFGQEARIIGEKYVFRKTVTLHVHTTDRYGRLVCDVISPDGVNYGQQMLREGAAWHYKAYDKRPILAQLEQQARDNSIGLWSYARPQQPWEYRRRKREQNK